MKVVVTGANGFVGRALSARLALDGRFTVRAASRRPAAVPRAVELVAIGDLGGEIDWMPALEGVEAVVHLAARVHMMRDSAADPLAEYRRVNVTATLNLARQSAAAGVRRFVFLSTVKVHGESGCHVESDMPRPRDAYSHSKHEAEVELRVCGTTTGMEIAVIRPPLVYGEGVKANFRHLMRAVARGIPLPLGSIHNRRSLVGVDNLVDFIVTCVQHPLAANQTFLVSDGEDLSTPDLVRRLARAMQRPPRLWPVPPSILLAGAALFGKRSAVERLVESLYVDISRARTVLGWSPTVSVDEGLRRAVVSFR